MWVATRVKLPCCRPVLCARGAWCKAVCNVCVLPRVVACVCGCRARRCVATAHWNPTVHSLAEGVLKHYSDRDSDLFARCLAEHNRTVESAKAEKERREAQWEALIKSVGGP